MSLISSLTSTVLANPMMAGGVGLSAAGGVIYFIKSLPGKLWSKIKYWSSYTLVVKNSSPSYIEILNHLGPYFANSRSRHFSTGYGYTLTVGYGSFWIWHKDRPLRISRQEEKSDKGNQINETLTLTVVGGDKKYLESFLDDVRKMHQDDTKISINIMQTDYWTPADRVVPRDIKTLSFDGKLSEEIIEDIKKFKESENFYRERGVPYRRGYLFWGPPGTGKSSLALALGGVFKSDIYILNLQGQNDKTLARAFSTIPKNGIVLIEDIDCCSILFDRKSDEKQGEDFSFLTLSGVLNVLDGVVAKEGRILIMTSNHPDKLDPALIRPGRIDRMFKLDLAGKDQALDIVKKFAPSVEDLPEYNTKLAPATIQSICQQHWQEPEKLLEELKSKVSL